MNLPWWLRLRAAPEKLMLQATFSGGPESEQAFAGLEKILRRADLQVQKIAPLTRASAVFLIHTRDHLRLLWKAGEVLGAREEAAYLLDRHLRHFARVPPVVTRELEGVRGTLRFYLAQARPAYLDSRSTYVLQNPERPDYYRMALLDCLLGNRDRHAGNWLLTPAGVVIPIDHGRAFPSRNGPQRFAAYDFHLPVRLQAEERNWLERLVRNWDDFREQLLPLVGEEATNSLWERIHGVLERNATFDWHGGTHRPGQRALHLQDSFQASFGARTGLGQEIIVSEPDHYQRLLEHIEVHGYYLGLERQRDIPLQEAALSWFESVYQPACQALKDAGLTREFPQRTLADLYLWLTYHRERIRAAKGWMPSDRFVALQLADRFSELPGRKLWKAVKRGLRAALAAARESPSPPLEDSQSTSLNYESL
jgi:hypothetical protein